MCAPPSLTRLARQFELPGAPPLLLAYVQLLLVQLGSWPHAVWAGLCVHAATYHHAASTHAQVARARLKSYAQQAIKDMQRDKKAAAQALKKLAQFNS